MPDVLALINLLINPTFTVSIEDIYPVRRSTFNHPIRITKRAINLASSGRNWAFNYDGRLNPDFRLGQRAIDRGNTRAPSALGSRISDSAERER